MILKLPSFGLGKILIRSPILARFLLLLFSIFLLPSSFSPSLSLIPQFLLIALSDEDLRVKISQNYYKHLVVKAWTSHGNEKLDEAIYYLYMADSIVSLTDDRSAKIENQINLGALYDSKKDTSAV